jgi:N-acetylglucosaminyldiphosphoundecaprenol N-acetyl-beta-D-mannosaminyltransferase
MAKFGMRSGAIVLRTFIDALSWDDALMKMSGWTSTKESRYVCICNVHSVASALEDAALAAAINQADMATPDGMPVAWALRRLGFSRQQRIAGPDFMERLCGVAARDKTPIYLYGSTNKVLDLLQRSLSRDFPGLVIAGVYSPPFRPLNAEEDKDVVTRINGSGARSVFVGLGCPKQELWMHEHRGKVTAVMIGVGAAFDFHSGTARRAPVWMQRFGLEWLHRLASEPRRLWKRYLVTNTLFILGVTCQLLCGGRKDR